MKYSIPAICCLTWIASILANYQTYALENDDVPQKPARSEFEMREFNDFISHDLSRPYSSGSIAAWGFETRKVYGQVVDHEGKPITNAQVAIAEPIGYSGRCYDENFDKTDEFGRFVVEGHVRKSRLAVRRGPGQLLGINLKPGQETLEIVWPKPAKLTIHVDRELCAAESELNVSSIRYCVGMSSLRYPATLEKDYQVTVGNVMPGDYSISVKKTINVGGEEKSRYVEVATVSLKEGESREIRCESLGHAQIIGKVANAEYLSVHSAKKTYHDVSRTVAFVPLDQDGAFDPIQLGTGDYVFRFHAQAKADAIGPGRFGRVATATLVRKQRITITSKDMQIDLNAVREDRATVAKVHGILDSEPSTGASWSHTDVQAAMLRSIENRDEVVNELMRLLSDSDCPHPWVTTILEACETMLDQPKVVDGLLSVLENPVRSWSAPRIIGILQSSKVSVDKVVDSIAQHRTSDNIILRSVCYDALGKLAELNPDLQTKVTPFLIEALRDRDDQTRSRSAAVLGRIKAKEAVEKLYELREDRSGKVAVWSAFAIWQITGAREQAIEILTARLDSKVFNGKWEAVYLLSEFDDPSRETIEALASMTNYESKPPFTAEKLERKRLKSQAERTLEKIAPNR